MNRTASSPSIRRFFLILALCSSLLLSGCLASTPTSLVATAAASPATRPAEVPVTVLPLAGPAARSNAELSGLAWYGDTLILLPQYPSRFGDGPDGAVFALSKAQILDFLDGKSTQPLEPRQIPLVASGLEDHIPGFEGYEAITFLGDQVFMNIEARPGAMLGHLVAGQIAPDLSEIRLDPSHLVDIPPQANLSNMSDETLFIAGDRLVTLYEANGANVNPSPLAHLFDLSLQPQGTIPFPHIEYRITDATTLDDSSRFWAINYFYPGDTLLKPAPDPLAAQYGQGATHVKNANVERLVEFQYTQTGISLVETPPIQLQLIDSDHARNWEGLARLEGRGFLLVTDTFPETIFGFVAFP